MRPNSPIQFHECRHCGIKLAAVRCGPKSKDWGFVEANPNSIAINDDGWPVAPSLPLHSCEKMEAFKARRKKSQFVVEDETEAG